MLVVSGVNVSDAVCSSRFDVHSFYMSFVGLPWQCLHFHLLSGGFHIWLPMIELAFLQDLPKGTRTEH